MSKFVMKYIQCILPRLILALLLCLSGSLAFAYPIDGYDYTGIKRLEFYRLAMLDQNGGRKQPPGGLLTLEQVKPNWNSSNGSTLPDRDTALEKKLSRILRNERQSSYGVALLDLSDPGNPRYAMHNPNYQANAGSVGKIMVALAIFQTLADIYPDDIASRERVLRDTVITADNFIQWDHHEVPLYDPETAKFEHRRLKHGDQGNLWEYLDWMMSASSNAAAGTVQKHLILLAHFTDRYPVSAEEEKDFFKSHSAKELGEIFERAMQDPVKRNSLNPDQLRQGSFFTSYGKRQVAGRGSYARPEQLVKFLFLLEAGNLVDTWSSQEIKRLMYMTQRRIRYASHPALYDSAVYFKSGSFYKCSQRGACKKYEGDVLNRLASVVIIETPVNHEKGIPALRYAVAVMSNVLRVNSAVAHQTLALRIHRMLERVHKNRYVPPETVPEAGPGAGVQDGLTVQSDNTAEDSE